MRRAAAGGERMPNPVAGGRGALLYAAAWVPLAIAYALAIGAQGAPPAAALVGGVGSVIPAAALGVPAVGAGARLAFTATRRALWWGHVWRAAAYATGWVAITIGQLYLSAPPRALQSFLAFSAPWSWITGLFVYGVLAGVGHAVAVGQRLREREGAAARAELYALRARLDPHFLFNTLHSLTALARRDPGAVERGLERFGGLLRYVLDANRREAPGADAGDADVSFEAELGFVRDYLALERLRLGDRLRVLEELDDEALECGLPALTLQPLVENAVRHGVAPRAAGGTVRLAARVDPDDRLVIEVGDDGAGCDLARVDGAPGVGVRVVRDRLNARYGAGAALHLVSAPGQGFTARLTLPARAAAAPSRPAARPAWAAAPAGA